MKSYFGPFLLVGMLLVATPVFAAPIVAGSFSTTWDTGESLFVEINLGVCPTAVYWEEIGNDTNKGTRAMCLDNNQRITFPKAGQYRVDFSGDFTQISLGDSTNRSKFRGVAQWGDSIFTVSNDDFVGTEQLTFTTEDTSRLYQSSQQLQKNIVSSSSDTIATKTSFLDSLRNFIRYLSLNETEIANLNPGESVQVIVTLRDALRLLLTFIPGV